MGWWITRNKLSTEQREFIAAIKSDLTSIHWIQGAAGTGKTTVLAALTQELRLEHPKASFCYLTYTHALKTLAIKAFKEENVKDVHFLTHTEFLKNNLACNFAFLDEVQDIKVPDLLKIRSLANHLVISGDCAQSIYEHSPSEKDIQDSLSPKKHTLILMHRLTEHLASIANKILPSANILSAKPSNTSANTTVRLIKHHNQNTELTWIADEALSRARPDKPCCILFTHHTDITNFVNSLVQQFNTEGLDPKFGYQPNTNNRLDYDQVNKHLKHHNINIRYLGNNYGGLAEIDQKPMVYLMTYHSAKGLDFDTVFIPQLNSSKQIILDFILKKNPDFDKRLLFVATTRSRCNLFITYSTEQPHPLICDLPNVTAIAYQPPSQDDEDEGFF